MLAGLGSALLPKLLNGHSLELPAPAVGLIPDPLPGPDSHLYYPHDLGIVDLHCHPSLKMYLWGRKLWHRHTAGSGINAIDLQDDMEQMTNGTILDQPGNGFVKGIVVAHYLPEEAITEQWDTLKKIYPWIVRLFRNFAGKLEHGDNTNIDQVIDMIKKLQEQVDHITTKIKGAIPVEVVRSYGQFQDAIDNHRFPIAHAIEGAHALGRNSSDSINHRRKRKPQQGKMRQAGKAEEFLYIQNLELLQSKGVCMMTLAHFFPNDIAYPVEGITPDQKHSIGMNWYYTPLKDLQLTPIGISVVNWMLKEGMIIDLTHSTPAIRKQVFDINVAGNVAREHAGKKKRPIVFTHTGSQKVFNTHDTGQYFNYGYYCVSAEDIASICECDGTIGVIPEVFWLAGGDTHLRREGVPPKLFRNAIPYMVETIQMINSMTPTQDYSHISIGTDFDGYADAPQDLYEASHLDSLIEALLLAGISTDAVRRIMSLNALRVLQCGWGDGC